MPYTISLNVSGFICRYPAFGHENALLAIHQQGLIHLKFLRHPHFFQLEAVHISLGCFLTPLNGVAALFEEHVVHEAYRH